VAPDRKPCPVSRSRRSTSASTPCGNSSPPLAVLVVALAILGATFALTGSPVALGIEFTGGTEIVVETGASQSEVVSAFADRGHDVTSIRPIGTDGSSYLLEFQTTDEAVQNDITNAATDAGYEVVQSQSSTATFGKSTQELALLGVAGAFVGMSVVVFLLFERSCRASPSCSRRSATSSSRSR